MIFKTPKGEKSEAQITAFEDTWQWGMESESYLYEIKSIKGELFEFLDLLVRMLGQNSLSAYLVMMSVRLIELHRILKETGSLYLHCDPTASHYLKIILDIIFGATKFRNEITWKRTTAHNDSGRYGANTDTILFFSKTENYVWNPQYMEHDENYNQRFKRIDPDGRRWTDDNLTAKGLSGGGYEYEYKGVISLWRCPLETMEKLDTEGRLHFTNKGGIRLKRYLDEIKGRPLQSLWDDIDPLNSQAKERLGYPTQKPLSLLERRIGASSNENDIVLDPFCGCGTTIHAAEKLHRQWIGIDITHLAISLIEKRLNDAFRGNYATEEIKEPTFYEVEGTPKTIDAAYDLFERDPYQFQWWAISLVNAQPYQGKKKGADTGIDGIIYFDDLVVKNKEISMETRRIIISVKGGKNVNSSMIRDLVGTVKNNKASMGFFITLTEPTQPMIKEAAKAGFYESGNGNKYPMIQIFTIEDLLSKSAKPSYTDYSYGDRNFKKAERESSSVQMDLF